MNTLAYKMRYSKSRENVAKRFRRVSSEGPWLLLHVGLRERLSLLESIAMRVINKIYYQ